MSRQFSLQTVWIWALQNWNFWIVKWTAYVAIAVIETLKGGCLTEKLGPVVWSLAWVMTQNRCQGREIGKQDEVKGARSMEQDAGEPSLFSCMEGLYLGPLYKACTFTIGAESDRSFGALKVFFKLKQDAIRSHEGTTHKACRIDI